MANETSGSGKDEGERKRKGGGSWIINIIGILALLATGFVLVLHLGYPDLIGRLMSTKVVAQRWDDSLVYTIHGVDHAGKRASFDFVVKTKDYNWVLASADQLEKNGNALSVDEIAALVFSPGVRRGLAPSPDVIAVGAASQEGGVAGETARAEKRGRNAAGWLKGAASADAKIWILNLGQYSTSCSVANDADTSWQRPFMFIGVRSQDQGVNLGEALSNAMSGRSNLPSTACYSLFQLSKTS